MGYLVFVTDDLQHEAIKTKSSPADGSPDELKQLSSKPKSLPATAVILNDLAENYLRKVSG